MKNLIYLTIIPLLVACGGSSNKDVLVTIKTSYGDMKVLLYEETPLHKANFLELARSGKYDSTIFHRVIENFMIQGGDIFTKEGTQEKGSDRIPAEIKPKFYHTKGALAAARQGDQVNPEKMSSSCQFYIVDGTPWEAMKINQRELNQKITQMLQDTAMLMKDSAVLELRDKFIELQRAGDFNAMNQLALDSKGLVEEKYNIDLTTIPKTQNNQAYEDAGAGAPFLDMEYTVFGRVVEGLDVIDKIAAVETGAADRPLEPVYLFMEVEEVSKKEIAEKYGYEYPVEE